MRCETRNTLLSVAAVLSKFRCRDDIFVRELGNGTRCQHKNGNHIPIQIFYEECHAISFSAIRFLPHKIHFSRKVVSSSLKERRPLAFHFIAKSSNHHASYKASNVFTFDELFSSCQGDYGEFRIYRHATQIQRKYRQRKFTFANAYFDKYVSQRLLHCVLLAQFPTQEQFFPCCSFYQLIWD